MDNKRWIWLGLGIFALILITASAGKLIENVDADQIAVIQNPWTGELKFCTTPGPWWQGFGSVTTYKKSNQYWFSSHPDQGGSKDESLRTRFNDGGNGSISGSVRFDLPLDKEKLTLLHTKFGSQAAIETALVRPVFEKAVFMSGPLMSSKESYSEKRNQLISFIEDQALNGVYRTTSHERRIKDPITGVEKTVSIVEIIKDKEAPGGYAREERSPLQDFAIACYNLSINNIKYDDVIEAQIAAQQKAIMDVQTAIADAKKAEQERITTEEQGKARAAKAKWDQETLNAQVNAEYEQRLKNAELEKQAAEQTKQKEILLGQGESERRKLVMAADGALDRKLDAYVKVMDRFAAAVEKQRWVPEIQMGAPAGGSTNSAVDLINLLSVKTAKDLSLDMSTKTKQ